MDVSIEESQHLLDFKLAIEYKYLMTHAPGGVYMLPEIDNIRSFHGVIFVRRGNYADVDPDSGVIDIGLVDESLNQWNPEKHFLGSALAAMKKIFYLTSYDQHKSTLPNETARVMFNEAKELFVERTKKEVQDSQVRAYDRDALPSQCPLLFTEPKPAHSRIRERVFASLRSDNEATTTATTETSTSAAMPSTMLGGDSSKSDGSASLNLLEDDDFNRTDTSDHFYNQLIVESKKSFL